jgi:hypothetical protein
MSGSLTVDELDALNLAFHLLARNLFTYSAEIGVFMAITPKDKEILAVRREALEESNDLVDLFSDKIVETGSMPRVGSYEEVYTSWSFRSESSMLPEFLREANAHRNKLISLLNTLTENTDNPPADDVVRLFKQAIASRAESLSRFNALADGVCETATIQEFDTTLGTEIEVDPHGH